MTSWMIRAGRAGAYAPDWLEQNVIGIGWDLNGVDIASMSHNEIRAVYESLHPDENRSKIGSAVGQITRFAHDMTTGSVIVMYAPQTRRYHIGHITGECVAVTSIEGMTYCRTVTWESEATRDSLSAASKNSLGSISTIFSISDEVMADLERAATSPSGQGRPVSAEDETDSGNDEEERFATYDDGIERIKDRVAALDWDDMEQLVAGLLRAMGYHAYVTSTGADGGRDVVASPDALGLESPRIIVEVKHRQDAMGAPAIRSFLGGLRSSDRGLYVSTGGFTREARYEADRSNIPIRMLDLDGFVRLYVEVYDHTDENTRAILPLVRIYWPA